VTREAELRLRSQKADICWKLIALDFSSFGGRGRQLNVDLQSPIYTVINSFSDI